MKPSSVSNGISRLSGSSLRTILPSRSGVGSFPIIAVQLKRKSPQLRADRLFTDPQRCADQKQSTSNNCCHGERTHTKLNEGRGIPAKAYCPHDQNHTGT